MKRTTTPSQQDQMAAVPELRVAMESINSVIESNRKVRSKVKEISAMTTTILAPLLNST